jgi:hypothetical protein
MKKALWLLAAILFVSASGCAPVGKMPVEIQEAATMMVPGPDEALVYIVRPTSFGGTVKFAMMCDGEYLGSTGGGRFIFTHQGAGPHLFVSKAENTSELHLELAAGETYYLEQQVKLGAFQARANLVLLEEAEGREKLAKCALSDDIVDVVPGSEQYMNEIRRQKIEAAEREREQAELGLD